MIVRGYGITLVQLSAEDLELVRVMRNSDDIRRRMQFQEEITPEMQQKWFAGINTDAHNYYVIEYNGEKVGLINGSDVDWEKGETGNGGIFIWEEKYRDSIVPIAASLLLSDLTFLIGLRRVRIKIMRDNQKAIAYNKQLGFRLLDGQDDVVNQQYELDEASYESHVSVLKKSLQKQHGTELVTTINNPEHPFCKRIIALYSSLSPEKKAIFKLNVA